MKNKFLILTFISLFVFSLSCSKSEFENTQKEETASADKINAPRDFDIEMLRSEGKIVSETPNYTEPQTSLKGTRYVIKTGENTTQELIVSSTLPSDIEEMSWLHRGQLKHIVDPFGYLSYECRPSTSRDCWYFFGFIFYYGEPQPI